MTNPTQIERVAASLTEAQRRAFTSRKPPNDYRAREAFALHRAGLLVFTPAGDVLTSPLGLALRSYLTEKQDG